MPHFTEPKDQDYKNQIEQWQYAWHHYTGKYANEFIHLYLEQKRQRETEKAYQERQDLSDPVLYLAECVDSLNGIIGGNQDEDKRDWGNLAEYDEDNQLLKDSLAYKIKNNADGEGMNWVPLMKQVGIRLTVMHKIWGLVEGVETEEGEDGKTRTLKEATVKLINPHHIVDWWPKSGNPEQVLVEEYHDTRNSIKDTENSKETKTFVLYELDGWTRFEVKEKQEGGETVKYESVIESGTYEYWADREKTMRTLPIFSTDLPMPRPIGYLLARKQNYIFNQKSRRDFAIGNMSFALGVLQGDEDQYVDFLENIDKGFNWLREDKDSSGGHRFISPDDKFLKTFNDVLEADKKDFYDSAFKQYADSAKQVTATEILQESRSGLEAFLSLLVTSLDEFENAVFWRLEQVYFPTNPSSWGKASVERSQEFKPEDINDVMKTRSETILNADRAGAMSIKTKVKELHPEWDDDQIDEEVAQIIKEKGMQEIPNNMVGG